MKTIILSMSMLFGLFLAGTSAAQEVITGPQLTFAKETHDFGRVARGGAIVYSFEFKNTGNAPLLIINVSSPCGCTVADWPKEPIAPGAGGKIVVKYDSMRLGPINKSVLVRSNAGSDPERSLKIKGEVFDSKETGGTGSPAPEE